MKNRYFLQSILSIEPFTVIIRMVNTYSYLDKSIAALLFSIIVMFSSCQDSPGSKNIVEEIDLLNAYSNKHEVALSSVATDIEYIPLETGEHFMTNNPYLVNIKDSLILFIGFRKLYIFSRNSGKFLYEISKYGAGPDEYSSTSKLYEEKNDLFYVNLGRKVRDGRGYSTFAGYNYSGKIIKNIIRPEFINDQNIYLPIVSLWPLTDSTYIGYTDNSNVNLPEKLIIFGSKGEFIKSYPSYNSYKKKESGRISRNPNLGTFFNDKDSIRFFEQHTDTVFNVNSAIIQPRYHINMGDLLLPYQLWATLNFSEYFNYFHIRTMYESSRFLMFTVCIYGTRHLVSYDKSRKHTVVCNTSKDLEFYTFEDHWATRCIGFVNDLDNFIPVATNSNFYINKKDELVTVISALEVKRWFDNNPGKAARLPENLYKLGKIETEDNHILIIASLKK